MIRNQQPAGKRRHVGRFGVCSGLVLAAFFVGEFFDLVVSGCPAVVADGRIFGRRASDIEFADVVHSGVALAVNERRQAPSSRNRAAANPNFTLDNLKNSITLFLSYQHIYEEE